MRECFVASIFIFVNIKISGVNYDDNAVAPFKWSKLLDERLDEARLSLKSVEKDIFTPLSTVEITVALNDKPPRSLDYAIATDQASEVPPGSGQYDHELTLIEPTKIMERVSCETLSFQNSLGRTYTANAVEAEPVYE